MKKITKLTIGVIFTVSMISCAKEHQCECVTEITDIATGVKETSSVITVIKGSEKYAEENCGSSKSNTQPPPVQDAADVNVTCTVTPL